MSASLSWFLCPLCQERWQLLPQGWEYLPAGKGQHFVGAKYKQCPHCREKVKSDTGTGKDQHPEKSKTASNRPADAPGTEKARRTPYKPNR